MLAFLLLEMLVATTQGIPLPEEDLISDVEALNVQSTGSSGVQQKKVAFFVALSNHLGPFAQPTDVVFDRVVTNIGSAYGFWSGRFRAPVSATYQFSVTLSAQPTKQAGLMMLKNGVRILELWSVSTPLWAPSSNVAVLSLKAGDQVWLQQRHGQCNGDMYTTFSGFLIFEN